MRVRRAELETCINYNYELKMIEAVELGGDLDLNKTDARQTRELV